MALQIVVLYMCMTISTMMYIVGYAAAGSMAGLAANADLAADAWFLASWIHER